MKKISLIIAIIINVTTSFAQDYTALHSKYWYYRTRLRNDFMKVGIGQGCSIPMQERGLGYKPDNPVDLFDIPFDFSNPTSGADAQWGDAMGELGYYIGVLATEYHLLILNNQETDSVRYELFCAMEALNRLDYFAEPSFGSATAISYAPDINGFMLRDDVPSNFIANNMNHFNYFGNKGFCSKVKIKNMNSGYMEAIKIGLKTPPDDDQYNYEGQYISQDNWYNCLLGLALVRKLVPDGTNYNYQHFSGSSSTNMYEESLIITKRVKDYFMKNYHWLLKYPDGSLIGNRWGGVTTAFAFGHAEALNKLNDNKWGYFDFPDWATFDNECEFNNWLSSGSVVAKIFKATVTLPFLSSLYAWTPHHSGSQGNPYTELPQILLANSGEWVYNANTTAITGYPASQDVTVMALNVMAVGNPIYRFQGNKTKFSMDLIALKNQQYAPSLARMVLHGIGDCFTTNFSNYDYNHSVSLLNTAPCEGPYNWFDDDSHTLFGPPATFEWGTTSRLDHPSRRGDNNNAFLGEYNGIDYMLYHNLVAICDIEKNGMTNTKQMVDFGQRHISISYPTSVGGVLWGSASNPATVKSFEYIVADNNVTTNTNVTYLAGKEITLRNGFSANNCNNFTAAIQQFVCSEIMSNPNNEAANYRTANSNGEDETSSQYPDLGATSYEQAQTATEEAASSNNANPNTGLVYVDDFAKTQNSLEGNVSASIAPNPNNGVSKLFITQPTLIKQIEVIDQLGKTLLTLETTSYTNDIDLSNYGKGVYSVILKGSDGDVIVKKVVVQ